MAITCGKCGEAGHNARSCGKSAKAAPAAKAAKAAPVAVEYSTVVEQLEAKRAHLLDEAATIGRIVTDLRSLDAKGVA